MGERLAPSSELANTPPEHASPGALDLGRRLRRDPSRSLPQVTGLSLRLVTRAGCGVQRKLPHEGSARLHAGPRGTPITALN